MSAAVAADFHYDPPPPYTTPHIYRNLPLIKEMAKSDVEKIFSGFSKTRDNLAVTDELLLCWNLSDTDHVLDELEEALLVADFGSRITIKIVESLSVDMLASSN
ncbi:hypothetical protein Pfo_001259 [Paulownia fortunei]|nr:hypothetical protein Pfo_001259 [Paulownia fortunei]